MYKEQDIFRIHTSNQLGAFDGGTSVVMFPLRLETKIIKREVTKYKDQAGVLFALRPLFDVVLSVVGRYRSREQESLETLVSRFASSVDALQTIYKEDKVIVDNVIDLVCKKLSKESEAYSMLQEAKTQLSKVAIVKSYTDNRAAKLIKDIRYHYSKISTRNHYGKHRIIGGDYSIIRYYTDLTRHIRAAQEFALTLCSRLAEIPAIDNQQYKVLRKELEYFISYNWINLEIDGSIADNLYHLNAKGDKGNTLSGTEKALDEARTTCFKVIKDFHFVFDHGKKAFFELLGSKKIKYAKTESTHRYTRLAFMIMNALLSDNYPNQKRYKSLWTVAGHTVFEYHQELEWTRKIVSEYNNWVNHYHREDLHLSLERLNKYSGYIRKRKMTITKQEQDALCVRIYPDELAVTQLSRKISRAELRDGEKFLEEYYNIGGAANGAAEPKQYAWDRLCMKYPPYRAAWIVRTIVTTPREKLEYDENIFSVPVSKLMPTRFTVQAVMKTGKTTEQTFTGYGNRLPDELKVGINFNEKDAAEFDDIFSRDPETGLKFKDDLRWMTDYSEAERIGMAVTIPLPGVKFSPRAGRRGSLKPVDYEFSAVYVTGCRHHVNIAANEGSKILEDMFLCHLYSEQGLDVINTSTPTNILDSSTDTSFNTSVDVLSEKFFGLVSRALPESGASISKLSWNAAEEKKQVLKDEEIPLETDSEALNTLFGFGKDGRGVFDETSNHSSSEMQISRTAKEYLLEVFGSEEAEDNVLIKYINNNSTLKDYFVNFVSPRGTYSAIRVGAQPYGILPVGDFRNLVLTSPVMQTVQKVLLYLSEKWNKIAEMNHVVDKQNAGEEFLQLMGKTPISSSYQSQATVSVPNFFHAEFFKGSDDKSDIARELSEALGDDCTKEMVLPFIPGYQFLPMIDEKYTLELKEEDVLGGYVDGLISRISKKHEVTIEPKDAIRHIKEFIDLFTYRLDAWMLGLLYYDRAVRLRRTHGHIAIGSYGWVFDLKNKSEKTQSKELSDFIVAPSVNQAITAAVMRGAYLNRLAANTDTEVVDVNLSSARVRKAIRIIEGVRNGLPIGAVLGADAERLLHDAYKRDHYGVEMDELIWSLRKKFPLKVAVGESAKESDNTKVTPNVFNGAQLIQALRDKVNDPYNNKNLYEYFSTPDGKPTDGFIAWCKGIEGLTENKEKLSVFLSIIGELYDSYDALMDVALSDSIYQLCQGNMDAAAAIMSAMETESMIPMPGVTEVPVDSARIENKVIIAVDPFGGTVGSGSYLYDAEPRLGKWIEDALSLGSHPEHMMAADLVYLSSDKERFQTYMNYLMDLTRDEPYARDVQEVEYIIESIKDMLSQARHLKFEDLMKDSAPVAMEQFYDLSDLGGRHSRMVKAVKQLRDAMLDLLNNPMLADPNPTPAFITRVRSVFWTGFRMGMTEMIDIMKEEGLIENNTGYAPKLIRAVERAYVLTQKRLASAAECLKDLGEVKGGLLDETQKNKYIKAMKELSTPDFTVVPVVILKNYKVKDSEGNESMMVPLSELRSQTKEGFFKNMDPAELDEWLGEMATLRPVIHDMYIQQMYASLRSFEANPLALYPMQLPAATSQSESPEWLGSQVSSEDKVFDANVYLVSHPEYLPEYNGYEPGATGLVLDFWTEKIPLRDQTAGLAFNYDQPDAEPPQSILLAMPETRSGNVRWTERRLSRSIKCALHLVKCRAVEPDHMRADRWASGAFPLIDIKLSNK